MTIKWCPYGCCSVKIVVMVTLCLAYLGLGTCIGIHGPTLTALSENTKSSLAEVSGLFTARSAGYLVGSIVAGILFDRMNRLLLLAASLLLAATCTALVPWAGALWLLQGFVIFQGVAMGFMDCGGNVVCIELWGPMNSTALQTLHFFFGLGSFLAPILARPFLRNMVIAYRRLNHLTDRTKVNWTTTTTIVTYNKIEYPYTMDAVLLAVVGLMSLVMSRYDYTDSDSKAASNTTTTTTPKPVEGQKCNRKPFEMILLLLLSFLFFFYIGSEVTYGGLISSFSELQFGLSQRQASDMASVFWAAFAIGRFASIFASGCLSPMAMIVFDLAITSASWLALLIRPSLVVVYVCSASVGLGMASMFPSGIAWLSDRVTVTGRYAAIFVVGSAFGEMVLPLMSAQLMVQLDRLWFVYFMSLVNFFSILLVASMWLVARAMQQQQPQEKKNRDYDVVSGENDPGRESKTGPLD